LKPPVTKCSSSHATGTGGAHDESLIESGLSPAVLDITTTEWAMNWLAASFTAGPTRLEAAARTGTPAIVAPGASTCEFHGARNCAGKISGRKILPTQPAGHPDAAPRRPRTRRWAFSPGKLNASRGR